MSAAEVGSTLASDGLFNAGRYVALIVELDENNALVSQQWASSGALFAGTQDEADLSVAAGRSLVKS